ncbi:hypothetical protein AB0J74_16115 [Asanoa sp. NPDC049573]|uniref:DUF6414 family protein n=1 Tax=Asanoa sp. NPDC049573 TaxID=3155396 RepID=UPI00341F30BC
MASEFTDTEANALKTEMQGTVGATVGVVKGETKSRFESAQTRSSQVLRKATVQTHFKELYELEVEDLAIGSLAGGSDRPPQVGTAKGLQGRVGKPEFDGWLIHEKEWRRGQLFEIEVELLADPIFRMSSSLTAVVDIISESPELFPTSMTGQLTTPTAINRVLERMMVGLIPVRGKALDYKAINLPNGEKALAHVEVLRKVEDLDELNVRDLVVVGVTEQRLYWKDVRQVLYSDARYKMLCRMSNDKLANDWRPVKMVDLLGGLAPDLPRAMSEFGESAFSILSGANRNVTTDSERADGMATALIEYARLIGDEAGIGLEPEVQDQIEELSRELGGSYEDLAKRRAAFEAIREFLRSRVAVEIDATKAAYLRSIALTNAGLTMDAKPTLPAISPIKQSTLAREVFLDSEIIGIYW